MKQLILTLVAAALVCASAGADDKAKKGKKGSKALSGAWVVVSATGGEESLDHLKGSEWTFAGDKVTNRTSDVTEEGAYQVNPSKRPRWITIKISKPYKFTIRAIYEVKGDTLQLCTSTTGYGRKGGKTVPVTTPRPTKFSGKQAILYQLKRKATEPEQPKKKAPVKESSKEGG